MAVEVQETIELEYLLEGVGHRQSQERSVFVEGGFEDLLLLKESPVEHGSQGIVLFHILLYQALLQEEHSLLAWLLGRIHQII